MRRAILLVGFLSLCGHVAAFQSVAVQRTSEKMELNVAPTVAQGSPETVRGVVPTTGRPTTATIHITPPSAAPISLSASTRDKENFPPHLLEQAPSGSIKYRSPLRMGRALRTQHSRSSY